MICHHCRKKLIKTALFCGYCGFKAKLTKEEKEQAKIERQRIREEKRLKKLEDLERNKIENRKKNLNSYRENKDILDGWQWLCIKSLNSCICCLLMDGKQFPLETEFKSHKGCRCTMISVIKGLPHRPRIKGQDWFESLDDNLKKVILGDDVFEQYKSGLSIDTIANNLMNQQEKN